MNIEGKGNIAKRLWLWTLILGVLIGGGIGYLAARVRERPTRPVSVASTASSDFDWRQTAAKAGKDAWTVLCELPGKDDLHKRRRLIVAQAVMPPAEQRMFFDKFREGVREYLETAGVYALPNAAGMGFQKRGGKGPEDTTLHWVKFDYDPKPNDGPPYAFRGVVYFALILEGEVVTLVVSFTEVHQTG